MERYVKALKFLTKNRRKLLTLQELFYYAEHHKFVFSIDWYNNIITCDGINFYLKYVDPGIMYETFGLRIHDRLNVKSNSTVLDIGACFGDTALYFSKLGAKVYAVEPNPDNITALSANLSLNPDLAKNIIKTQCAIGGSGELLFKYKKGGVDGGGSAFTNTKGKSSVSVISYTLAEFMNRMGLKQIDYLKMDAKGAEAFLTVEELKKIKKSAKIEYTNIDLNILKEKLDSAGFKEIEAYKHNPAGKSPLSEHGTVLAIR